MADKNPLFVAMSKTGDVNHNQVNIFGGGGVVSLSNNTSIPCTFIYIKAKRENLGNAYIGRSTVTSSNGFVLAPGEDMFLFISDVVKLYVTGDVDNDDISWISVE